MPWPDFPGLGQAVGLVKETGIEFMNNHTPQAVRNNISLTSGFFSKSDAQSDIDAGRPIVLGMHPFNSEGSFHVVPAYGYAKLDETDGFLVHWGWGSDRTQVWVPSSWFAFQIRMSVDHEHDWIDTFVDRNNTHRELTCSMCGASTVENLYNTSGNKKNEARYPLSCSVTIPSSIDIYSSATATFTNQNITSIGNSTFANQMQLSQISIPSSVTSIGDSAFKNCSSLASITLNNIQTIGAEAFKGCNLLSNISLPASLTSIGEQAFVNCNNLNITVSPNNLIYSAEGNILYGNAKTELLAACNISSNIAIPNSVTKISSYAFEGNSNLNTLHFYNNPIIGEYAFANCSNMNSVFFYSYIIPTKMMPNCFSNNNFVLYTPYVTQELYRIAFADYTDNIDSIEMQITFISDEEIIGTRNMYFGSIIDNLIEPVKTGHDFYGWYDNSMFNGMAYQNGGPLNAQEDFTLYAKWEQVEYLITMYPNGGELDTVLLYYTIEDNVVLPVPTKQGYTFSGWYYDSKLSVPANDYIPAGSFGDKQLYAKWKGNIYAAAFDLNDNQEDPANGPSMKDVIYGKSFTFDIPYRNGFIFNGWKDSNGKFYTGSDGKSTKYWDIAGNTILYADWIRETYYIKIDANGHIFWMTNNDIKEESDKTGIEYGTEFLTIDELLSKFNPYKQGPNGQYKESLKEGYKFLYFTETQPPVNGWGSTIPSQFTAWDKAPKLGENEAEITIYAYFVPEMNFNLVFIGESIQSGINPVTSKFNADINLVIPQKREYARFIRWKVADVNENRIFDNTYLRVGQIFDFTKMPDLSIGREEDGTSIWLESVWVPLATITFSTGYGTVPSAFNKIDLGTYITLPILSCTGRTFHGWYSDSNGSGVKFTSGAWNKQGLTALYAYWTTNKYSITYTLNGGSHSGNPTNYTVDDNIILKDAEQTGYRFMGWYGDSSFTGNRIYSIPQGSIEDFTLYANFKVLYSITLILEGFDYATYSKIYGETIHLPSPVKGGYKASWGEYSFGSYYVVTQSKTFNAYWTEKTLDECYNSSTRFYEIFTYNQLNTIRDKSTYGYTGSGYEPYISGNFKLMVSVYFSGYWTPIPYNFRGTFDGNNNCINNMKISTESNGDFGFFERIYYGTVRNLNLYNVYIYGSSTNSSDAFLNVGAVAGTNGYGNISNCTVKGTITVYTYKNARIGGIVGYNYSYAEITNCDNYATINGYRNIGGIAGENHYSAITFCDNYGNINFYYNSGNGAVGGIVGHNRYSGNVANCINKGTIKYASSSSNNKNIAPCMAQIIGLNESGNYSNNTCSGNTDFTNLKTNAGAVFGIGGVNQRRYCSNGELGRKI